MLTICCVFKKRKNLFPKIFDCLSYDHLSTVGADITQTINSQYAALNKNINDANFANISVISYFLQI